MKYVGIDLGTTNSAICSYDGESVHLHKSPEQNDVTPSAIFVDRRGKKYYGSRAYDNAARNPDNAAVLFKRLMGTSTPIKLPAVDLVLSPEECSAEILQVLFAYLPEEIRTDSELGTVITVPAAFEQPQKDATMSAAETAGIGRVALMQEPVAAVMSVMRQRKSDGKFLVYDIGGGTLDVAIAESISGRVNLLAHGGIAMCGGRDFDRMLFDSIVMPWLFENFNLPDDLSVNPQYRSMLRLAQWATEKAKIELSQRDEVAISLPDTELRCRDSSEEEIYIDIVLDQKTCTKLISPKVDESIEATRETLEKAGLNSHDIERIVFVGGPAQYKPLRDKVSFELGISASTEINPMTAVAEGAAVFAESIDWTSKSRGRKSARGTISAGKKLDLIFNYIARTPQTKTRAVAKLGNSAPKGAGFQIDSLDTGWSSGRVMLVDGASVELTLNQPGDNTFKIFIYDSNGAPLTFDDNRIVIARTAASIDAIPASHSIGIEVKEKIGGRPVLDYLIREGDHLPKKGKKTFKAENSLRAGSSGSIDINIREGDIANPIQDNKFIGLFQIRGSDFDDGVIVAGAELICDYEILDSGALRIEVKIPSVGYLRERNFYSSQEGKIDYSDQALAIEDHIESTSNRLDEISAIVEDERLEQARSKLQRAKSNAARHAEPEVAKQAMDDIQQAKRYLSLARSSHEKEIRQLYRDKLVADFDSLVRSMARSSESTSFDNLAHTAQRAIDNNDSDFDNLLDDMRTRIAEILWRDDGFVIHQFKLMSKHRHHFRDKDVHAKLVAEGEAALGSDDMEKLRNVMAKMASERIFDPDDEGPGTVNIIRGHRNDI